VNTPSRRRILRGTVTLVRRYLPSALAVAGVVALLDLTPSLRAVHRPPVRRAPTSLPSVTAPATTTASTTPAKAPSPTPTARVGTSVPTTVVVVTTGTRPH